MLYLPVMCRRTGALPPMDCLTRCGARPGSWAVSRSAFSIPSVRWRSSRCLSCFNLPLSRY